MTARLELEVDERHHLRVPELAQHERHAREHEALRPGRQHDEAIAQPAIAAVREEVDREARDQRTVTSGTRLA